MNRAQRLRVLLTHAYAFLSWGLLGPSPPEGRGDQADLATAAAGTFASIATMRVEQSRRYISLWNTTALTQNFTLTPRTTGGTASAITAPFLAGQIISFPTETLSDVAPPSSSSSYLWLYSDSPITGPRAAGGTGLSGNAKEIDHATPTNITTSAMLGLGNTWTFTPTKTGVLLVTCTGYASISGGANQTVLTSNWQAKFGTGTAPANGAAISGTSWGPSMSISFAFGAAGSLNSENVPLTVTALITGLTVGTAYWFDMSVFISAGAFNFTYATPNLVVTEYPS